MIVLLPLGAILLSALVQGLVRRGSAPATDAAPALRQTVSFLIVVGALISVAPLIPLALDAFSIRSASELLILLAFLFVVLATVLPVWIWILVAWRRSQTRSASAFSIAASIANIVVAVGLYRGLVSGDADAQDGIVMQIAPLLQLLVTSASALVRRAMDRNSATSYVTRAGAGRTGTSELP